MVWVAITQFITNTQLLDQKQFPEPITHTLIHTLISSLEQNFIDLGSNLHLVIAMKNYNLSWSGCR